MKAIVLAIITLTLPLLAQADKNDQLLVFVQPGESELARHFEDEMLPAIESIAESLGVTVHTIDARNGTPADVHLTPLLVFQNERGRSVYQGRYGELKQVRHFLKTTRALPQDDAPYDRENIATWTDGRMRIGSPVKVTPLAGAVPDDFDSAAFREEAAAMIFAGLDRFERAESATFGPSDRLFYMDFHPYLSESGRLYISTAVFSQFNCDFPVYEETEDPVYGQWGERDEVFQKAVRVLERQVLEEREVSRIGDGFDMVPENAPIVSYDELGFPLPEAAVASAASLTNEGDPAARGFSRSDLPERWTVVGPASDDASPLQFRFPAPLERYAGYSDSIEGELVLGEGEGTWADATGWITIPAEQITMGNAMLDAGLHGSILQVSQFPEARFEMNEIRSKSGSIASAEGVTLTVTGTFAMTGIEYPIEVEATLLPRPNDGKPAFAVSASFDISLADPFGIDGPEGPEPANDTVLFFLNFMLEPADAQS